MNQIFWQVDDSTYSEHSGTVDLPDGLIQFRMNLVELLVDICQLLRPATFIEKVSCSRKYLFVLHYLFLH